MKLRNLSWPVLLALVWLGGCRALPPAPPPAAVASAEEVLARLQSRQQNLESFQAKGRITFLSPDRNYSGTALLKGRRPTTLKADILDFLGRTILSFASNGAEVQVLSPKEGKLFSGQATPRNLAALIPPQVTLPQAVRLMVGALPLSPGAPDRFAYDGAKESYRLEWRRPDGGVQERLWVAAQGLYPVQEEWYGNAPEPRFVADLANFGALAPEVPEKITLKTGAPQIELRLVYSELRLNPALTVADLSLQPPPGVSVVPLGP